ncbi:MULTISPECIES: hypothetical protein [Spirulina sp. CCY15215]|uniref:hypothetical protein n=1 Tax=Spirulina sp. CCY15215 TaxID=2767591 RepID=UPI00194FBD43|nr:hypothetical protein [Spirulina major]
MRNLIISIKQKKSFPAFLISFSLVSLLFLIGSLYPLTVKDDIALLLNSVQQFVRGEIPFLNFVTIPNATDLSQDKNTWLVWYPPGITILLYPLRALGIPLGISSKLTVYFFYLSGCFGWITLASRVGIDRISLSIFACILPLYSTVSGIGGATELINGEVFPFGIMPWLFLYVLYITDLLNISATNQKKKVINLSIISFLLGWIYWLKYSAFIVAFCLFLYLQYYWLIKYKQKTRLREKITGTFLSVLLFLTPYLLLGKINFIFAQSYDYINQATSSTEFAHYYDPTNHGIFLLIALIGTAGLSLFQASQLFTHLIYFNTSFNPFIDLSFNEKGIPLSIIGIPGTLLIIWLVLKARKIIDTQFIVFACWTGFFPLFILAYLAQKLNYNYLIYNTRHASSSFLLLEAIVVASLWNLLAQTFQKQNYQTIQKKVIVSIAIAFLVILPNLFHISFFLKDKVIERLSNFPYISTENQLYVPILSKTNLKSIVSQIHSVITSPQDIIVLGIDENTNFEAWLEMKQRTIPLVRANGSFFHSYGDTLSIYSDRPFFSSQNLRIILVVSPLIENNPQRFIKLKERFPQALIWNKLDIESDQDTNVSIYFSDLNID